MKFVNGEAGFAYQGWAVSLYRSRLGNKMDGRHYQYSFQALKAEPKPDGGFAIVDRVEGKGTKQDAINAIKTKEAL